METRSLIQVRQGKRPVVNGLDATMPGDFSHASEDGLRAMQETIDTMTAKSKARADDPIGFNDAEFHQRLAAASGNRLMRLLVEALKDPLRASRIASRQGRFACGLDDTGPITAHQEILDKVAAKDPEGAARAMELHLEEALEDLLAARRSSGAAGAEGGGTT